MSTNTNDDQSIANVDVNNSTTNLITTINNESTPYTTTTTITTSGAVNSNVHHPKHLKKQITYSCGMKLDNLMKPQKNEILDDNSDNTINMLNSDNRLHRCKEVENLAEQQEHEIEIFNQDLDALHSKTHLKRTEECEDLNDFNTELN